MKTKKQTGQINFLNNTLRLASEALLARYGTKINISSKSDRSLVTDADLASEKTIIHEISKYFPDDQIYSEESGLSSTNRKPGGYIWIIDPLDGTTNFANNYPFFCVSIARGRFTDDNHIEVVLGGVEDPLRKKKYIASLGEGAFCNERSLCLSSGRPLDQSFLVTGFYYKTGPDLQNDIQRFAKIAHQCQAIRRDGAAALDLALVAEGVFDGFWEAGIMPWDVAAGSLLVKESGGIIRNFETDSYNIEINDIIAGPERIVNDIASLL